MMNNYESLEQRIAAFYYLTMPKCVTVENSKCTIEEQKNLYAFIKSIYKMIYDNPKILFASINDDDGYPNMFNCKSYKKDYLIVNMRKDIKIIDDLLMILINLGKEGIINDEIAIHKLSIPRKYVALLLLNNVEVNKNNINNNGKPFFNALKWFANTPNLSIRRFSTCSFDNNYDYVSDILTPILSKEEGACKNIIDWLKSNGYKFVLYNNNDYKVDYYKNINNKIEPVGISFHGDPNHIGFSMEYRYTGKIPYYCTIRILKMKSILNDFSNLSQNIQKFIININKKCDNCRYCIQTDKTNTRPKASINVNYQNSNYTLCPLYQGFWFSFRDITIEEANTIIEFLQIIEKYNLNIK